MKNAKKRWMTLNLGVVAIMPTLIFLAFLHRATADDPGSCFMVTSSGKTVSLGSLCGATPVDSRVFRIPIKRRMGKTPVVDVTFNQQQTFEMILDTGASSTLITQKMANALKLQPTGKINAQIADGTEVQFVTSQVQNITVGSAVASNIEVAIAPKAAIGLLGHDFFENYDIKILEKEVEFRHR
ncbi:retroviral-like aspartic protease family protein [Calothrix sp. FACHB-1219]|uniref:retropepsin-like aspartic protease family protein n=1 Tax=unclassified Calothrix TaxID=2619626 RepID=UPI0016875822|nr:MULTISPECIES: retropepsin-like aspartic protease [unclassified Calothrix]MBD2203095.1 retroviral-like aspartic protease family protein [Calothrix sp. FACHB-168]MBD2218696.1 retroviral-like aspartic protease family protein [Calothrix sp. FACHB-1219]